MPTFNHCFNFEDRIFSICTVHPISRFRYLYGHEKRGIISDAAWRDYEIIQWIELSGSICLLQFAHVRKDWSLTFFDFDYFGSTMIDCWFLSIWFLFFWRNRFIQRYFELKYYIKIRDSRTALEFRYRVLSTLRGSQRDWDACPRIPELRTL